MVTSISINTINSNPFVIDTWNYRMSKIESIADNLVDKWCNKKFGLDSDIAEELKQDLIDMISSIHSEYIIASIRNEVCGESLHSQFEAVMGEFRDLKSQLRLLKEDSGAKQVDVKPAKTIVKKSSSKYGPFISKVAMDFASENQVDPNTIIGTGKDGKISKSDISKVMKKNSKKNGGKDSSKYCNGHTANGDPCKSIGKVNIKGKWFCNRHKSQGTVCENIEETDNFENYDNQTETDKIDRFRDASIKSLETVGDKDAKLNDMMDDESEKESVLDVDESEDDDKELEIEDEDASDYDD